MMAPAIIASLNPSARPMPSRATPMVAIVVQLLPIITDTAAQIRQADTRKKRGDMIFIP